MSGKKRSLLTFLLVCSFLFISFSVSAKLKKKTPPESETSVKPAVVEAPKEFQVIFQGLKEVGTYTILVARTASPDTKVIKSVDGTTGYLVKTVKIQSDEQLIRLMGAQMESELTDAQKGILEMYRYSKTDTIKQYLPMLPYASSSMTIEMTDFTGFEDGQKYPNVTRDFWPCNSKVRWMQGDKLVGGNIVLRMSAADSIGYGEKIPEEMRSTFVHEFAHSFDLTEGEENGYGADGIHYLNEIVKERAAFVEGFAVFNQMMVSQKIADRVKDNATRVMIEGAGSQYQTLPASDPSVSGKDLTHVEAVNAMILYRLAKEIPEGRQKIFEAFKTSNTRLNCLGNFLKTFIAQNASWTVLVAQVLDQETQNKLSTAEIRDMLGSSPDLETYLAGRPEPAATTPKPPSTALTDNDGILAVPAAPHYNEIKTIQLAPIDSSRKKVKTNTSGSSPFDEE